LSSPACDNAWRRLTAKHFFFNELASINRVRRSSSSARTVIGDTAIAVPHAAIKPGVNNGGEPTNGINKARKDSSITAIGSANTDADAVKTKPG
jgi:hypothetical protein